MKIVHLNNTDNKGGAAKACFRLNNTLNYLGHDSKILVQEKFTNHDKIYHVNDSFYNKILTFLEKF